MRLGSPHILTLPAIPLPRKKWEKKQSKSKAHEDDYHPKTTKAGHLLHTIPISAIWAPGPSFIDYSCFNGLILKKSLQFGGFIKWASFALTNQTLRLDAFNLSKFFHLRPRIRAKNLFLNFNEPIQNRAHPKKQGPILPGWALRLLKRHHAFEKSISPLDPDQPKKPLFSLPLLRGLTFVFFHAAGALSKLFAAYAQGTRKLKEISRRRITHSNAITIDRTKGNICCDGQFRDRKAPCFAEILEFLRESQFRNLKHWHGLPPHLSTDYINLFTFP